MTASVSDDSEFGKAVTRLTGCHQNGLEAFATFAAAVALAMLGRVPAASVDFWAQAFVATRIVYNWIYITGVEAWKGPMRSVVWALGFVQCLWLLFLAGRSP